MLALAAFALCLARGEAPELQIGVNTTATGIMINPQTLSPHEVEVVAVRASSARWLAWWRTACCRALRHQSFDCEHFMYYRHTSAAKPPPT